MRRFLITLLAVCCLAGVVQRFESGDRLRAGDQREVFGYFIATLGPLDWVRTSDGWERREVLFRQPQEPLPSLPHPGLIAAFQVGLSLFALLAFPSPVKVLGADGGVTTALTPRPGKRRVLISRRAAGAS